MYFDGKYAICSKRALQTLVHAQAGLSLLMRVTLERVVSSANRSRMYRLLLHTHYHRVLQLVERSRKVDLRVGLSDFHTVIIF